MRAVHAAYRRILAIAVVFGFSVSSGLAQCPEEAQLQNYTGGGTVSCPCFAAGERAGAVLNAPAQHYPIEILRVGIGWGSQFGGAPQSAETAIHVYSAGLPNPGTPIYTLPGPVLNEVSSTSTTSRRIRERSSFPRRSPSPWSSRKGVRGYLVMESGDLIVHWRPNPEADIHHYNIYRGYDPGFEATPATLIASPPDTMYLDADFGVSTCYKVTAVDIHGNESRPPVPVGVGELPGVTPALFQPVAPAKMADLASRLGLDRIPTLGEAESLRLAGRSVRKGDPLFPRDEASEIVVSPTGDGAAGHFA